MHNYYFSSLLIFLGKQINIELLVDRSPKFLFQFGQQNKAIYKQGLGINYFLLTLISGLAALCRDK